MHRTIRVWSASLALTLLVPLVSVGQSASGEAAVSGRAAGQWSWVDVREKVEGGNAAVKASLSGVDAAKAWEQGAGAWPNPELALEIMGFGVTRPWLGPEEVSVGVRQAIPLTARRDKERALAGAGVEKAEG